MFHYGAVQGAFNVIAFRTELSIDSVTHNAGNTEIDLWIMHIFPAYGWILYYFCLIHKGMPPVLEVLLMILCCRWSISRSSCVRIISSGFAIFSPVQFNVWGILNCYIIYFISFAMMLSLLSHWIHVIIPVFDSLSRKYYVVFQSDNFSGYPRKFMSDMRYLISISKCGSESLYHCCNNRIFTMRMGS